MDDKPEIILKSQSEFGYTVVFRHGGVVVLNGPWHVLESSWAVESGMDPRCSGAFLIPTDASDSNMNPNATTIRCFDEQGNHGMRDKNQKLWEFSVSHFAVSILQNRR